MHLLLTVFVSIVLGYLSICDTVTKHLQSHLANNTLSHLSNSSKSNHSSVNHTVVINNVTYDHDLKNRTFKVDYNNNQFLKDNKPFRYVAGEMHYFRVLPEKWRERMLTMRAAGVNVLTTYAEWATNNPHDGEYVWTGMADIVKFIRIAAEEDLLVILRPGPYICAERSWVCIYLKTTFI